MSASPSPAQPVRVKTSAHRRRRALLLGSALAIGIGGCSADGSTSSRPAGGEAAFAPAPAQADAAGQPFNGTTSEAKAAIAPTVVAGTQRARRADLSVQVPNVSAAAASVRRLVLAAGGQVTDEKFSTDGGEGTPVAKSGEDTSTGTLTLSVPTAELDRTLDQLAALGTVTSRTVASEDLSATIVDTTSRVATMRESLARVRALMDQATKLSDVVSLESELTRRQSDLESLESTLAAAKNQVTLSPIILTLSTTASAQPAATGFIGGLRSGWDAFVTAGSLALTVLGAVLPFLLLGLLVGWPLARWLRKRRPIITAPVSETAQP